MMFVCQILLPLLLGGIGSVATTTLQTELTRQRSPKLLGGGVGRVAQIIQELLRRGIQPAVTTGPFGDVVVGTADQDLPLLANEAALRQLNNEVLSELLMEDPLLFIRNLPFGDPRRVAVGLDAPGSAGLPSSAAPPGGGFRPAAPSGFTTRSLGRFAFR